ncbi:transcriptional regulator [Streptosporangium amethystogenes]|uniref:transcriptional regulator n=1 Tax=Streptosporangium amethystogenes TaxID=2002 RepID=UPI00378BDEB0
MDEIPGWALRLRAERRERLWSQRQMARALTEAADESTRAHLPTRESLIRMIKDWEKGKHQPKDPYRVLYCRAFDLPEAELFDLANNAARRSPAQVLAAIMPEGDPLSRLPAGTGRRVGMGTVRDLAARVHGLRLADDVIAGSDLIRPAFRELDAAVRLYRGGTHTEEAGRALLVNIGELAQIVGWIASDAGQHDQAAQTYQLGISAAREAGDGSLQANLIGSLAYQIANVGDAQESVALTRAALDTAGRHASPRIRALTWDRLAWAHARAGEAQPAIRALGEASAALASTAGAEEPSYLYWVSPDELQIMEARAYTELRRPLRAVPLLTEVLTRYDATHVRELALYLSWLAVALADANEPEEAAHTASRMLDMSADLTSDRTTQRARVVLARLKPYADVPEVRELLTRYPMSA